MSMLRRYTTLIVGAGRFARNYLRVMAGLNRTAKAGVQPIVFDPLIVTRTSAEKARDAAAEFARTWGDSFSSLQAEEVKDRRRLKEVLSEYAPGLICITARDPEQGDSIHAEYSRLALDFGAVLCEKPFSCAGGDGSSLAPLEALLHHRHAGRFSLHLPMAVVLRAMQPDARLGPLLDHARQLHFLWQKQNAGGDLIDDLAVHPWSLIPGAPPVTVVRTSLGENGLQLEFRQASSLPGSSRTGSMLLQTGGTFRGMCIDSTVLQFQFEAGMLRVLELDTPWSRLQGGAQDPGRSKMLLEVENPLQQHLRSLLMDRPIVDMQQTLASQRFLESARRLFNTECEAR